MLLKGAYCVGEHFVDPQRSFPTFISFTRRIPILEGLAGFHIKKSINKGRHENSVGPDQLASQKPADLHQHCLQNRIFPFPAYKWLILSRTAQTRIFCMLTTKIDTLRCFVIHLSLLAM